MVCMIAQSFMDCNHFFTEISQNCDDIYYANTDLHIIQELENKDIDLIMRSLSGLN